MVGYAICAEPRSGTNYLGRLLQSTGVLGRPWEWFNRGAVLASGFADWPREGAEQLAQIPKRGAMGNGVYAVKVFSDHFDARPGWPTELPDLHFVHLTRTDLLGQALSLARARQTQQWTQGLSPKTAPAYCADTIEGALKALAIGDMRWRSYFARNGIEPLRLVYEDVLEAPQAAVDAVAALVGIGAPPINFGLVDVQVQRDELTEEWRARFLAERRNLNHL